MLIDTMDRSILKEYARQIRRLTLQLVYDSRTSHIGGSLSQVEILAVLYSGFLNNSPQSPKDPKRDRFILSKGHCCASYYAALALRGFISPEELRRSYCRNGSEYFEHVSHKLPGIEFSSGSLGHGLPVACGMALAGKQMANPFNVYVLCGDGEMNEGSNWEAIMFARHHNLSNLCIIIDKNGMQAMGNTKEVLDLTSLDEKLHSFGCNVLNIDGHDIGQIETALMNFTNCSTAPTAIIANTIKGRGISFMENNLRFHYSPPTQEEYLLALRELS